MSSGRSLQGNQVGAPCGWAATMTPSLSSSQPASPSVLDLRIAGWPENFTRTSNSVPAATGLANHTASAPSRWV